MSHRTPMNMLVMQWDTASPISVKSVININTGCRRSLCFVERDEFHQFLGVFRVLGGDYAVLGKAELACREIDDVEMVGKEMVDVPGVHIDAKS